MPAPRRTRIPWRRKALAFHLFDVLPGGRSLYYLTQRYVTRAFPRPLAEYTRWPVEHARVFLDRDDGEIGRARLFEFGAGWDLFNNLVQWCYGINHQTVVDVVRWARVDQINHAIRHLPAHPPPEARRVPEPVLTEPFDGQLSRLSGID